MTNIVQELGHAGAEAGWRKKVADQVVEPASARTPISETALRTLLGLFFLGLSVYYLAGTARRFSERRS